LAIEVIVNDTSCLIDLHKGGLLTTALLLPFRFIVALPLITAELHSFDDNDWSNLHKRGLHVVDLDAKRVERAFTLKSLFPGLSAYDCFSLALAESTKNAVLLTGDQQLRARAVALVSKSTVFCGLPMKSRRLRCCRSSNLPTHSPALKPIPSCFFPLAR